MVEHSTGRGTPTWLGLLVAVSFVVALVLAYGAGLLLIVDCNEDYGSECSTGGYSQFGIALLGTALALGALIAGVAGRSRPGVWLCSSALVFMVWFVVIFAVGETS